MSEEIKQRGSVLLEAINVINGERQNVYGDPEDSFELIAQYWNVYLQSQGITAELGKKDVALMMVLFKFAREAHQHKRDNVIDWSGYSGIYADMCSL